MPVQLHAHFYTTQGAHVYVYGLVFVRLCRCERFFFNLENIRTSSRTFNCTGEMIIEQCCQSDETKNCIYLARNVSSEDDVTVLELELDFTGFCELIERSNFEIYVRN